MVQRISFVLLVLLLCVVVPAPLYAQRGQLIEGLFRSIVETELEKNKQRELQRRQQVERAAGRPLPSNLQPFPTPSLPPQLGRPGGERRRWPGVPTRDQRLVAFRDMMGQYTLHVNSLTGHLRQPSGQVDGSRKLIGDLLHLQAHADSLAREAAAAETVATLVDSYCELDSDWRPLSYELRTLNGLDAECVRSLAALDGYSNQICKLFGVPSQFDRGRMQNLMIVATTYMDALLDDLQLIAIDPRERQNWIHDGRILQQQLRREAEFATTGELNDIMPRYNEFVMRWREYAAGLYGLNNPHVDMRLERIRQCGSEVFTLLYMPPTPDLGYLQHVTSRLERQVGDMLDQLSVRSLVRLPANEQNAIINDARQLYGRCRALNQAPPAGQSFQLANLQSQFGQIDRQWHSLESRLRVIDTLGAAPLSGITRCCSEMRDMLGMRSSFDRHRALELAASLEGQAEYWDADIQRYRRYYSPRDFGDEYCGCSERFLKSARQLNAQVANGAELTSLQTTCQALLTEWEHLAESTQQLPQHGLSGTRPDRLSASMRELAPIIAELAALLMG